MGGEVDDPVARTARRRWPGRGWRRSRAPAATGPAAPARRWPRPRGGWPGADRASAAPGRGWSAPASRAVPARRPRPAAGRPLTRASRASKTGSASTRHGQRAPAAPLGHLARSAASVEIEGRFTTSCVATTPPPPGHGQRRERQVVERPVPARRAGARHRRARAGHVAVGLGARGPARPGGERPPAPLARPSWPIRCSTPATPGCGPPRRTPQAPGSRPWSCAPGADAGLAAFRGCPHSGGGRGHRARCCRRIRSCWRSTSRRAAPPPPAEASRATASSTSPTHGLLDSRPPGALGAGPLAGGRGRQARRTASSGPRTSTACRSAPTSSCSAACQTALGKEVGGGAARHHPRLPLRRRAAGGGQPLEGAGPAPRPSSCAASTPASSARGCRRRRRCAGPRWRCSPTRVGRARLLGRLQPARATGAGPCPGTRLPQVARGRSSPLPLAVRDRAGGPALSRDRSPVVAVRVPTFRLPCGARRGLSCREPVLAAVRRRAARRHRRHGRDIGPRRSRP